MRGVHGVYVVDALGVTVCSFGGFAPEELEETGIAGAHSVGAYGGFFEAFDGLLDHLTDYCSFFFGHCGC